MKIRSATSSISWRMSASPSPWAAQEDALSRVSALAAEGNIAGVRALSAEAFADPWHLVHCSQAVAFSPVTNDDSNLATNSIQLSTIVGSVSSVVDWILHRRADLSCWDSRMRQVIHHAAASASALLVLLFCHLGVDLETKDRLGRTPLALAVESGDAACIAALLMNGASMAADSSSVRSLLSSITCSCLISCRRVLHF